MVTTKRLRVKSTVKDVPVDPITAVVDNDEDDADVDATIVAGPYTAFPPLRSILERVLQTQSLQHIMMETFMMTQAAHRRLLDKLIPSVTTLKADFIEYRSSFPSPPP